MLFQGYHKVAVRCSQYFLLVCVEFDQRVWPRDVRLQSRKDICKMPFKNTTCTVQHMWEVESWAACGHFWFCIEAKYKRLTWKLTFRSTKIQMRTETYCSHCSQYAELLAWNVRTIVVSLAANRASFRWQTSSPKGVVVVLLAVASLVGPPSWSRGCRGWEGAKKSAALKHEA